MESENAAQLNEYSTISSEQLTSTVRSFIEWLSFHPIGDEIARALVSEHLAHVKTTAIGIFRIQSDDSLILLGQYGKIEAERWPTTKRAGSQWRTLTTPEFIIATGANKNSWAPNSKMCVISLRDHGVIHGFIVFEFLHEISQRDKAGVKSEIEDFAMPIALSLSFQHRETSPPRTHPANEFYNASAEPLTQRQILILRGMVEGKTNHELASEMGFSVSTIRHETMRIFKSLAVNDRKEAAKRALDLSLI